jgi:hypothetical protein
MGIKIEHANGAGGCGLKVGGSEEREKEAFHGRWMVVADERLIQPDVL